MMTNDCPEAVIFHFLPLLGGHRLTIFAWWKEENWNVFLRCTLLIIGDSLNTILHRSTYSHDVALVDQGGSRPTF